MHQLGIQHSTLNFLGIQHSTFGHSTPRQPTGMLLSKTMPSGLHLSHGHFVLAKKTLLYRRARSHLFIFFYCNVFTVNAPPLSCRHWITTLGKFTGDCADQGCWVCTCPLVQYLAINWCSYSLWSFQIPYWLSRFHHCFTADCNWFLYWNANLINTSLNPFFSN